jgi:hypothetical protein
MIPPKTFQTLLAIAMMAFAKSPSDSAISRHIALANKYTQESTQALFLNGPKTNENQFEATNKDNGNKIHLEEIHHRELLDLATKQLDSALRIDGNRVDVWAGKTQIAALYGTCDVQTNAFDSLVAYFRSHAKELHLQDGAKIKSVDDLIKSEFMYAINRRWEAKEDSCNLALSRLLVRTYPEYVPGLNVVATIVGERLKGKHV